MWTGDFPFRLIPLRLIRLPVARVTVRFRVRFRVRNRVRVRVRVRVRIRRNGIRRNGVEPCGRWLLYNMFADWCHNIAW